MHQESFSRLWDGYETDGDARAARDARSRELQRAGHTTRHWTLMNQARQYASFGVPDDRSCPVFVLNVLDVPGRA